MRSAAASSPRRRSLLAVALVAVTIGVAGPSAAAPRPEAPAVAASASHPASVPQPASASHPASVPQPASAVLAPASPDLPGLPPVSPELASVPVDSVAFRRARARYDAVAATLAAGQRDRVEIDRAVADVGARQAQQETALVAARARAAGAKARLDAVEAAIADLAVSIYTSGGPSARVDAALATEQPAINDADRRDVLASASMDVLLAERAAYRSRLADAQDRIQAAQDALADLDAEQAELAQRRPPAVDAEVAAAPPVAAERVAYEDARVLATVEGVDFTLVALDAYHRAAASTAEEDPACGVRWWAIAGISRVEGNHGTYGGAALDERGDATKRIIGIQLNGTNNTQVVPDSDGGELDGDPAYDRAVGPMQFIPQTWARFAADGNEDDLRTPFNIYDATLAAARYLCHASSGLDAEGGLRAAYFSYNHSDLYVDRVLSFARRYEQSLTLPDPRD